MYKITFDDGYSQINLELTRRPVQRETGDVCLSCYPHCAMPVKVAILVRGDGSVHEWYADWETVYDRNPYWHFDHGSGEAVAGEHRSAGPLEATAGQRRAIAQLFFHKLKPWGIEHSPSAPVQQWCKYDGIQELEALGNDEQRGFYA